MEQLHGDKPNVPFNIKHINIKPKLIIHEKLLGILGVP